MTYKISIYIGKYLNETIYVTEIDGKRIEELIKGGYSVRIQKFA